MVTPGIAYVVGLPYEPTGANLRRLLPYPYSAMVSVPFVDWRYLLVSVMLSWWWSIGWLGA